MNNYSWALPDLLNADENYCNSIFLKFIMKDKIDVDKLNIAAQRAMSRFSFLKIKLTVKDNKLNIVDNDKDIVISKDKDTLELFSDDVNQHLLYLQVIDNHINFHFAHAFTDGSIVFKFAHTVIYLYCTKKYKSDIDQEFILLPGQEPHKNERKSIFDIVEKMNTKIEAKRIDSDKVFNLKHHNFKSKDCVHSICFKADDYLSFCKKYNSSPASTMPSLCAKAIFNNEDSISDKTIMGVVKHDPKIHFGCLDSLVNITLNLFCPYTQDMEELEDLEFYSQVRPKIRELSNKDYSISRILDMNKDIKELTSLNLKDAIKKAKEQSIRIHKTPTYATSYVGQLNWGNLEDYIEDFFIIVTPFRNGPLIELSAIRDKFNMTMTQPFETDYYVKGISEELTKQGVPNTIMYDLDWKRAKFNSEKFIQ